MKRLDSWVESYSKGDVRALGKLISAAEDREPGIALVLSGLFPKVGKSKVLGITGPPGAGKSTLIAGFVRLIREAKKTVAIVAVDPVSPFTGGALLGDRIRLGDHFNDEGVFIRSLSTRGKLGGLSLATREVVHLLDAFGFDYILIETVGVGQSEVEIRKIADGTLVVLVPEWGDAVQTLKAGLLEIGDLFAVNKSDREGADRIAGELRNMLQLAERDSTPVLLSSASDVKSVTALWQAALGFFKEKKTLIDDRRKLALKETVAELLEDRAAGEARAWVERHVQSAPNPYDYLAKFLSKRPPGSWFGD